MADSIRMPLHEVQRDRAAYRLAKEFLLRFKPEGVTKELVEKYLRHTERSSRPKTIEELYRRILESAQSANMKVGVIGRAIGGVEKLGPALCRFQPRRIVKKYNTDWEQVLDEIERRLKPKGSMRRTSRSIWPGYCRTILSAAQFMSQFAAADDFYEWMDFFDKDDRARPALPMLLSCEIYGLGFALACDFLKELGDSNYAKPDVHLRDIFEGLALCPQKASDYQLFKAVVRVAKNADVTPYNVDKLFWLIGSGHFSADPQIGVRGRIGGQKKQFIASAQKLLESKSHSKRGGDLRRFKA